MLVAVCPLSELAPGDGVRVGADRTGDRAIAVFNADGDLYAVDDSCTHQDASLSDGWLEGCWIECPLHAAMFDLRTGAPDALPATVPVRTHPVTVVDGVVCLDLTAAAAGAATAAAPAGDLDRGAA